MQCTNETDRMRHDLPEMEYQVKVLISPHLALKPKFCRHLIMQLEFKKPSNHTHTYFAKQLL